MPATLASALPDFRDTALVIAGHGSTVNAGSALPVIRHAAELRQRGLFATVSEGFWKQPPLLPTVVGSLTESKIIVVPLFISEGWFTGEAIPGALGLPVGADLPFPRIWRDAGRLLVCAAPVGTHAGMTAVVLARVREALAGAPAGAMVRERDVALFLAGHGTERNENSRRSIERQAAAIRAAGVFGEVHAVFMEEPPRIAETFSLTSLAAVVVVPYFISDGMHVSEDIPVLLGEEAGQVQARLCAGLPPVPNPARRDGRLLWYTPAVGTEPGLAEVILERAVEATAAAMV